MAVRKGDTVVSEKQGKIELVFVRLEGNDATLQEVVRTFNGLVNRSATGAPLNGSATPSKAALPSRAPVEARSEAVPSNAPADAEVAEPEAEDETVEAAAPKTPRKYPLPTAIPVETEAPLSLVDYLAGYKLESEQDKYLAFAGWL